MWRGVAGSVTRELLQWHKLPNDPRDCPSDCLKRSTSLSQRVAPHAVARNAAADAARQEMEFWLKLLERIKQEDLGTRGRMMCSRYIRNLRRKLGVRPSKEEIREQTRLRVRRFRERAKSLHQK